MQITIYKWKSTFSVQTVDMRWGIRNEAQDDHMTTDICLKEVEQCKQKSTGPCFLVSPLIISKDDLKEHMTTKSRNLY